LRTGPILEKNAWGWCWNRKKIGCQSQPHSGYLRVVRAIKNDSGAIPVKRAGRLRQRHGLIVKGKRISCPPPQHLLIRVALPVQEYDYEHGFPLIRSLRASTQRSISVLFSFVLSLLIVAESFGI
jgi:hypothetical protein